VSMDDALQALLEAKRREFVRRESESAQAR
jgi:hypothetical protein